SPSSASSSSSSSNSSSSTGFNSIGLMVMISKSEPHSGQETISPSSTSSSSISRSVSHSAQETIIPPYWMTPLIIFRFSDATRSSAGLIPGGGRESISRLLL